MDDRLRLIRYLYDEEVDESALARRLSDDPDLYREYEELAATKRALDDRPARRPDAAVVDQVVDQARTAAPPSEDRPARAPSHAWARGGRATERPTARPRTPRRPACWTGRPGRPPRPPKPGRATRTSSRRGTTGRS
ncbi:hypothetical protein [Salinibacter ruber]|uniref:hypothetical protein n=1 Tax=Salinibacter ruber TaxID=146919 RepID=UPI001F080F19|nr:hypothetical protein [Salinibacter ruber]